MTLRRRILLALALTLCCLVGGLTGGARTLLLADYARLERQSMTQNAQRASRAFAEAVTTLHERTTDWAAWDDTYQFMRTQDSKYIASNLTAESLQTMQMDMVVFVGTNGTAQRTISIGRLPKVRPPALGDILRYLDFPARAKRSNTNQAFSAVMAGQDAPLMLSVRPITKTDHTGKPRGWLIMARHFDAGMLKRMGNQIRLDVRLQAVQSSALPADCRKALPQLTNPFLVAMDAPNENTIVGYTLIEGLHSTPLYLLKTVQEREIHHQGLAAVGLLVKVILGACAVFSAVILLVVERVVLARLSHLGSQLETIADRQGSNAHLELPRVSLQGKDELNALAARVNGLLHSIESYTQRLHDSEEEIRAQNETLEQAIAERTADILRTEQELRERNAVLENVVEGIARLDAAGKFVAVNSAYTAMLEYAPDELLGKHWTEAVSPIDHHKFEEALLTLEQIDKIETEVQGLQRDGWTIHQQSVLAAIRDEFGDLTGVYMFAKDVSERTGLEAQMVHQAYHDALTGLPNRTLFMERMTGAQRAAKHKSGLLAVVFIDLDNFKIVNDSLGHEAGDALLSIVAERLLDSVRVGDMVSRLGGDEFTLLLEDVPSEQEIVQIVERIVEALRAPILLPQKELFASASIGIAYTDGTENLSEDTLLRYADTAMYHAKSQGKCGYALFDPAMNAHVVERMEIETGLRLAIERDEFVVQYQPLVNLESGRIVGAEALVRWEHPTRGMVSPSQFIPIAEEAGLIAGIGYLVLEKACRQWKTWADSLGEGFDFIMNVNLSGRQLQRPDVVERVTEVLDAIQMPPQNLKLEITESVIMENMEDVIAKLREFRNLGIKLAIDDFGTGYSSMSSLSSFPVNTVKIDKAFVQQLGQQEEANAVVAALIMLSKTLRMDVTAEGVEQKEQVIQLQTLGCHVGQGYYFARPTDAAEFTKLLEIGLPFRFETDALHRSHIEELLQAYLPADKAA